MGDQASILSSTIAQDSTIKKTLHVHRWRPSHHKWKHVVISSDPNEGLWGGRHTRPPDHLRLITWNLDFNKFEDQSNRLLTALRSLQFMVLDCGDESPGPTCILLQEITPAGLSALLETDWVRQYFYVTPIDPSKWPGPHYNYGNVTLVHKSIPIFGAHILHYGATQQERSAIEIDVRMRNYTLRIINSHLESLAGPTNKYHRFRQLFECAKRLKDNPAGGFVAGDLNAIDSDWDERVYERGLVDAGEECRETGHTWGDQRHDGPEEARFPNSRMDRIVCHYPQALFRVTNVRRIGIGLRHEADWVSDHFGLAADVVSTQTQ
ncbi:hypothetical protein CYLTODRAFT_375858 [Cylindrobasidium torrendii FP15055 ss-10]|uniref:Endonuclease/exonuclease/phosphatase domain-containing protein n=1 Tax=Cylindrobasidium torrendii FP15055 ss-10 TaxID=1314674 RepID=A0A0D7BAG9_9AGAR|nr:hypothetical protein CYLTODRAFT_375858 [Cylindrobasidium torrendii FP15055 ss-10]